MPKDIRINTSQIPVNVHLDDATSSDPGLMSASDKSKLAGLPSSIVLRRFGGRAGAGACNLSGGTLAAGATVLLILGTTDTATVNCNPNAPAAGFPDWNTQFESTTTVANQIQQTSAQDYSANLYTGIFLVP